MKLSQDLQISVSVAAQRGGQPRPRVRGRWSTCSSPCCTTATAPRCCATAAATSAQAQAASWTLSRASSSSDCPRSSGGRRSPPWAFSACSRAQRPTSRGRARRRCWGTTCWWRCSPSPTPGPCTCSKQEGITRLDVVSYISHGVSKVDGLTLRPDRPLAPPRTATRPSRSGQARRGLTRWRPSRSNLNAAGGGGRHRSADRPRAGDGARAHILARRRKNNPLLVGESGVGKTAIVEGLAREDPRGRGARAAAATR